DARLARLIADKGRGSIILLNKWDLVPSNVAQTTGIDEILKDELMAIDFAPVLIISAMTGRGVQKIFDTIDEVYRNFSQRIPTKRLNHFLKNIVEKTPPPIYKGREIKFYYISQPLTEQPTFVIFTNRISGVPENYKRFLENRLREEFDLEGTPIKLVFRSERNDG
ncbi:MAG: ribosome biogenesis GTPase Der, partial [Deltaproteobacteria bacterium]|nr:ribosome biogenesis GTPase Der [Deltaproteobacteria bacterium]